MFHAKQFAYFVRRMAAAQDGDGSLLDHSMLLYGAGISDSNVHMHDNACRWSRAAVPAASRADGTSISKGTRGRNLFLNMLDKLGVPADRIGDDAGRLEYLSEV